MTKQTQTALILFGHGSRDPGWLVPFERLQQMTQTQLPDVLVKLAFLELMEPRLPQLLTILAADGVQQVRVVPVFLGQGGHVKRDLPVLIAQAQMQYPAMQIKVVEAVGEQQEVLLAIAQYCAKIL